MIEAILQRWLTSRGRHWAVIILILGIGVAVVLPSTDEYYDSRHCRQRLSTHVAQVRSDVASLDQLRQVADQKLTRLNHLEALAVPTDQVHLFRQELVDWARSAGCQIRRIRTESPQSRPWHIGDSLLDPTAGGTRNMDDSPYRLNVHPLSLSVSGTLSGVKALLDRLHSTDRLIRNKSLAVYPPGQEDRRQVVMDLELNLFNLTKTEIPSG
jgi:hypothetical protein